MILRRLGNKSKMAKQIQEYFPPHKIYIEPFFGAGGMFFNKPKVKYNIVNDNDSDVFNLFQVVMNQKDELVEAFRIMPIHQDLLEYWKKNKETEPIRKALRFLFLKNMTFFGQGSSIRYGNNDSKSMLLNRVDFVHDLITDVQFTNCCYTDFFKKYSFTDNYKHSAFIYADPPYLNTGDSRTYESKWTQKDSEDLFECLIETKCKFAISEFDNPIILKLAEKHNLQVIELGERRNLKNTRMEILIINYPVPKKVNQMILNF